QRQPGVGVDRVLEDRDRAVAEHGVHAAGVAAAGGDRVVVAVAVIAAVGAVVGIGRHHVVVARLTRAAPPPGRADRPVAASRADDVGRRHAARRQAVLVIDLGAGGPAVGAGGVGPGVGERRGGL